ncbi:MAG TPA: aspartate carbamoyltransferase catalytic subunit [Chthonomonadales bacterium]|nr:aspartate carbamoyltransferase catalytic subunit [Chthonomonadales bacterium]
MRDLISLRETDADDLRMLLQTAAAFGEILERPVKKVPTLRGRTVVTLFYEASTRTRTSFELAAKYMSADAVNISVAHSAVTKGESLKDTLRTLQSLTADCIVIRHGSSGAAHLAAQFADVPVINAGDGRHEHPTQGLLDILTIWQYKVVGRQDDTYPAALATNRAFDLSGLTVAIVGDLAHSRVARSNVWGLSRLGASVRWCGPRTLVPACASDLPVSVHTCLAEALDGADVVMVLRLQRERMEKGLLPSLREYARLWGVDHRALRCARPDVLVMHPGPINRGVEISADVADGVGGIRAGIERQVTNGVAVRMAALYLLIGARGVAAAVEG